MFPPSFSFHETCSKHRNPEEIAKIEKQNRALAARIYQYGEPINNKGKPEAQKSAEPCVTVPRRGAGQAFPLARFLTHFFSFFTSRA
jgi:hypothetical protein